MNRLGTFLHIRANLPNIIISPSVFLKKGTSVGRHCLTCKVGVIAVRTKLIKNPEGQKEKTFIHVLTKLFILFFTCNVCHCACDKPLY